MLDDEGDEGSAMRCTQVDSWAPAESSWRRKGDKFKQGSKLNQRLY